MDCIKLSLRIIYQMASYENTVTLIFFIPALLCVFLGLCSMLTCGCGCFCNNEQESPPSLRRRRRRTRLRDHYVRMSDCEGTHIATSPPASWRCRGHGHLDAANIYRDRRLCSNFDVMAEPPPSYTFSMQHHCSNYLWNHPVTERTSAAESSVRLVESSVHDVSMIRVLSRAGGNEETRLDEVEEEKEEEEESPSLPPPYDTVTSNQRDTNDH